jgi:PASTA domain
VSLPTASEQALAAQWRVSPQQLAAARDALNHIANLDWPLPDRVNLVARLAKGVGADVGRVFAGAALARTPLASFDLLLPVPGLGQLRVRGLMRALATLDLAALQVHTQALALARQQVVALQAEVQSLKQELDRIYALLAASERPAQSAPMRMQDLTESIMAQVRQADQALMQGHRGLRLGAVELDVQGGAAQVDGALALDLAAQQRGSRLALRFAAGRGEAQGRAQAGAQGQVPNVAGYTVSLARRKLAAAGLKALVLHDRTATTSGVVRQQSPIAGASVPPDGAVRLVLG